MHELGRRQRRRLETIDEIVDVAAAIMAETGPAGLSIGEVARRMGIRPPSLYVYFDSKNAIYDAMFGEAWTELSVAFDQLGPRPANPRKGLLQEARTFFDFSTADLARYQLMNQRTIPDFVPSDQSYAASVAVYGRLRAVLRARGVRRQADLDLWTALLGGFIDQQLANDPDGTRWRRQLPRLVDMYCDEVGIPGPRLRRTR